MNKELEDAQTTIQVYRDALASAEYEVQRLRECIAILKAENPKPKKKERKSLQSFVRSY
jgi:hypothetical protein